MGNPRERSSPSDHDASSRNNQRTEIQEDSVTHSSDGQADVLEGPQPQPSEAQPPIRPVGQLSTLSLFQFFLVLYAVINSIRITGAAEDADAGSAVMVGMLFGFLAPIIAGMVLVARRSRWARPFWCVYWAGRALDAFASILSDDYSQTTRGVLVSVIWAIVWFAYWLASKTVKQEFPPFRKKVLLPTEPEEVRSPA